MLRIQGAYTLKSNLALNWYQHVENVIVGVMDAFVVGILFAKYSI